MAHPFLQNEEPGDRRDQRRESAFERRACQAGTSGQNRRSVEPLSAGDGGRVRDTGAAAAAWSGSRGASAISRDARERGTPRKVARAAAARAGVETAARG